ncbi:MAG: pyrroline-5-carboxylate reductase [Spirochaetaceae bacterium]|jgi:pyrroline-5-carboxylate reductase|nr:pyrroline-5-carboxylate reductase [Spirochaetaceae bacterium]
MPVQKIGFAGLGNMGQAILKGIILKNAIPAHNIAVLSRSESGKICAKEARVTVCSSTQELAAFADIIILAVKPKDAIDLIRNLCPGIGGKALLSIVAGLDYKTVNAAFWGAKTRTLIALPNTPVQAGEGITGFTIETTFTDEEKDFVQKLFESVSSVEWIDEKSLPAFSALSASAPAYAAIFTESLADGAVLEGLPRDTAYRIAAKMITGTGFLMTKTGSHPGILKDKICSPGGTTIEGIAILEDGAFRANIIKAMHACTEKFKRLNLQ